MAQTEIFGPFFVTMLLTVMVWVYMYILRIHFIFTGNLTPEQLASPAEFARLSPPAVYTPSDNLKNLFEIPVLFYALVPYLYATGQVDATHVLAAWVFVGFRILHSVVHCTFNLVNLRFFLYLISTLAVFLMLGRAALGYLAL
jgi:hypothetical protein